MTTADTPVADAARPAASAGDIALAYHARTKHGLKAYARRPQTLDWDLQPDPFRTFEGAPRTTLPLAAEHLATPFAAACRPGGTPARPLDLSGIALLLELSFGLSAWKELGPDRWALRCNPSSGNLHPTEAYVLARGISGLANGLHHYVSRDHVLEQRCTAGPADDGAPVLLVALSSIHWREAWKYGERAFRYCQLDLGHALGAVRYAAGALGWTAACVDGIGDARLAALLGTDRAADFGKAEREDPDLLIAISAGTPSPVVAPETLRDGTGWAGTANVLDRHPLYRWPVINEVSRATEAVAARPANRPAPALPPQIAAADAPSGRLILGWRSAQRFDAKAGMDRDTFYMLMDALLVRPVAPWDVWAFAPRLHPILFVHRVAGLAPGLYALPRDPAALAPLKAALRDDFTWTRPEGCPEHLPLRRLVETDCRGVARTVMCHQAIASDGCFALGMLADFEDAVRADAWRYRQLHWEAGLMGQVLYLEAEAAGFRGTGIGCFFDDDLHRLLGLEGDRFQSLYHFTVGRPLADARILTRPAYPGRSA